MRSRRWTMMLASLLSVALVVPLSGVAAANPPPGHSRAGGPTRIGQVGPIAPDNPRQQPFACVTQLTALGEPVVDNHAGIGHPVTDAQGTVVGYSADCGAPTRVDYFYRAIGDDPTAALHPYDVAHPPSDVATTTVRGRSVPFIVRYERGTINRFIYSIALLAPHPGAGHTKRPDLSGWNRDLVFYFIGGTGVGHTQAHDGNALRAVQEPGEQTGALALLSRGYAVINSTGAATATTYNLQLTGETARMVKRQFVETYGHPRYTFGLGGSGGAVQQFVYAQNDPSLLDALIPIQPFPDMITQVNPVGDCELLEYYMDVVDAQVNGTGTVDPKWTTWADRQLVIGLHGIDGYPTHNAIASSAGPGSDVCLEEWRGAIPLFFNPLWGATTEGSFADIDPAVLATTPIGYFDDLLPIFGAIPGTDIARSTFNNVGVQYGLRALQRGQITVAEFLNLNAHIGGWKPRQDMVEPGWPYQGDPTPDNIDPWSSRNGTAAEHLAPGDVAPRSTGSLAAMQNAYRAGLVFHGDIDLPIIIIEPYLEPELNEHASREPFAVRERLIAARGNADNLAIWMLGSDSEEQETTAVLRALDLQTQWLDTHRRPAAVQDACFDDSGGLIAEGRDVFDGEISADGSQVLADTANGGPCTQAYPIYGDARTEAGEHVADSVFACQLQPVDRAL
ncbi:MAG TPA: DUF6351 family protein, partial [Nakamurella sp.]|nr:DUF6351 family protein [Nakamurella sp.]